MAETFSNQNRPVAVSPASPRDATFAVLAGFFGWTLDAFDFFLVVISLTTISKSFDVPDSKIALSIAVTLAFRPVGAILFGLLADRYGRRIPMMIDLIFYSAVEVATAFTHSFTTFLILRALFGIGMGGEWGVGASLVMEKVPPKWRGLLSGILQEGYAFGYLLAAVAAYFLLDPNNPDSWRPLFILGGLPALLALFIRMFVHESEVWKKTKAESWTQLFGSIGANWKIGLYLTLLMAMMNFSSHGTQDMYPTFLKRDHNLPQTTISILTAISMCGAIAGGIIFGLASDRFGRRAAMVVAFALGLCVIPLWAFAPSIAMLAVGAFLLQFMVQGAWGVIPAHINELSPDNVRGFLPGVAYQFGNLISSTIGYLEAIYAAHLSYAKAMALMAATIFVLALIVTLCGPEKRGVRFGQPETAGEG
jgi:MFS transporter, SHS family, lactate transporter